MALTPEQRAELEALDPEIVSLMMHLHAEKGEEVVP
jgi:hypothetical protein